MTEVRYCTREIVKSALDFKETARSDALVDAAIESASRDIEGLTHRIFYPLTATRRFDYPSQQTFTAGRIWLDAAELVSISTLTSGGTTISPADVVLYPDAGPPYNRLEISLSSNSAFSAGPTAQKSTVITGVFGLPSDTKPGGSLSAGIDASQTTITGTNSSAVGVGSILEIGTERMIVTEKAMTDTTQNTTGALTASAADVTVGVGSGAAFTIGEILLIGAERMLIVDIAGNNLIVKRAWDGSVLATHATPSDVYAPRSFTVVRGALGTTAAAHLISVAIGVQIIPSLISKLTRAITIDNLLQDSAGWSRTSGSGDNEAEASGKSIGLLRDQVYTRYGRKARMRAV